MTLVNDVFELTVEYQRASNIAVNVYFYQWRNGLENNLAVKLIDRFKIECLALLRPVLQVDGTITRLISRNLFSDTEFSEDALAADNTGTRTGARAPDFIALELSTPRKRIGMRRGMKRLPFMSISDIEAQNFPASLITAATNLCSALSSPLETDDGAFYPVIVKRLKTTNMATGKTHYVLPANQSQLTVYEADEWGVDPKITTQRSRKAAP